MTEGKQIESEQELGRSPNIGQLSNGQPSFGPVNALSLMRSQKRPVRIYLVGVLCVLGLVSIVLCNFPWLGVASAALVLIAFIWSGHTAWLFLFCFASIAAQVLIRRWQWFPDELTSVDFVQVLAVFGLLATGFRYAELRKYAKAFGIDSASPQLGMRPASAKRHGRVRLSDLLQRQAMFGVIAFLSAMLLLIYLPSDDSYLYEYWLQPKPGRLIILALVLFFAWFVMRAIVSLIDWWIMSPEKADVAFRSWYNREMWREMAGVEKRRRKIRMKNIGI